jgi:hypothetical protein
MKAIDGRTLVDFNEWRFGFLRFPSGINLGTGPCFPAGVYKLTQVTGPFN